MFDFLLTFSTKLQNNPLFYILKIINEVINKLYNIGVPNEVCGNQKKKFLAMFNCSN